MSFLIINDFNNIENGDNCNDSKSIDYFQSKISKRLSSHFVVSKLLLNSL